MSGRDPVLSCFTLCDRMLRDQIAAKWGALGLHCGYKLPGLPFTMQEIWFFLRVADAPDKIRLAATITSPTGLVVYTESWDFDRAERAEAGPVDHWWEIGGRMRDVTLAVEGRYAVEISLNGALLGETPLYVSVQA